MTFAVVLLSTHAFKWPFLSRSARVAKQIFTTRITRITGLGFMDFELCSQVSYLQTYIHRHGKDDGGKG
jgi:dolichyl-phosphate-mannose--protein O-mannosyl transferase